VAIADGSPLRRPTMKITFDIDCTPEEVRRLVGLPDMAPLHELYIDKARRSIEDGVTPDMVETMIRTWNPMGEAGLANWQRIFDQVGGRSKT
jgi:hypothetical protein